MKLDQFGTAVATPLIRNKGAHMQETFEQESNEELEEVLLELENYEHFELSKLCISPNDTL